MVPIVIEDKYSQYAVAGGLNGNRLIIRLKGHSGTTPESHQNWYKISQLRIFGR